MIRSSVPWGRSIRCAVIVPLLLLQEDNESLVEVQEENMKYLLSRNGAMGSVRPISSGFLAIRKARVLSVTAKKEQINEKK